jgi:hypothetical protein
MTVRVGRHERDAGQAQEARWVGCGEETLDEARSAVGGAGSGARPESTQAGRPGAPTVPDRDACA